MRDVPRKPPLRSLKQRDETDESPDVSLCRITAAAARVVAGRKELQVEFASGPAGLEEDVARIPPPPPTPSQHDVMRVRGQADALALRHKHQDPHILAVGRSLPQPAREIFAALEQARCEALGAGVLIGVDYNLQAVLDQRCRSLGWARRDRRESAPLPEIINLLAREAMTGSAPPPSAAGVLALWRPRLWPRIGVHLTQMAAALPDPHAFTRIALALLTTLDLSIEADEEGEVKCSLEGYRRVTDGSEEDVGVDQGKGGSRPPPPSDETPDTEERSAESLPDDGEDKIESTADDQGAQKKELAPTSSVMRDPLDACSELGMKSYQAWDKQFDQIIEAQALCSDEELSQLRLDLDQLLGPMRSLVGRLANRLQRQLQARLSHGWVFDQEQGLLDTARLARIVADPTHPLSFKRERELPFRDTIVTLLIDNSGSMRGQPIQVAALSTEILARTLERCQIRTEILGFTTRDWMGGRPCKRWRAEGQRPNPGRLNELRHIIYKSADTPWRRARKNLGLMLRNDLLKENIDGEALLWASDRLLARPERRRILMVISDGSPLDHATLKANPPDYLEKHLLQVIAHIEAQGAIELLAIGIGYDVTDYYRQAVMLDDEEQLGHAMTEQLCGLFAGCP